VVQILEEVPAVARTELVNRLQAFHFKKSTEDVVLPVLDLADSRQLLKSFETVRFSKSSKPQVDRLEEDQNETLPPDPSQKIVQVGDVCSDRRG